MAVTDDLCSNGDGPADDGGASGGAAMDVAGIDARGARVVASVVATALSRLAVAKARLLPVIEADGLWALGGARSFPLWVSREHQVSVHTARAQVRFSRTLRDHLPMTAAAASAGHIGVEQAQVLAAIAPTTDQRRDVLADAGHECNEAFLVEQARILSVDALRVLTRQWAAYADPDADDRGYVEAADREHLEISRLGDGYHVDGRLTLEHGQTLKAALAAVTPVPTAGDVRSAGQRRAQALADLARVGLDHGLVGAGRAVRPRISVLVDHPTFVAVAGSARATGEPTQGPAHGECPAAAGRQEPVRTPPALTGAMLTGQAIAGGPQFEDATPIPRALLDRLACDSEVNRIVFGPRSEVLDVGRAERTFTRALRSAIVARDRHCRYPGCTAPPALSEGHHVRHWSRDGGPTSVDNGILLCWYHHDLVHRRHIDIRRRDGRWLFIDARGAPIEADGRGAVA